MLNCFANYGRFSSPSEAGRYVIWNGSKDKPPAPEEQLAASQAELKRLRESMGIGRPAGSPPTSPPTERTYHTYPDVRQDTRELTPTTPRYQKTVEAAEKALALKGYLPPAEVVKIQGLQEHMYQQYLNPGFMLYLQRKPKDVFNKVYADLELIFKNPYDFDYISLENQRTEIRKRETSTNAAIRDNFLVVMETKDGHITEAGGENLKNSTGGIPWMLQPEYNRQMPNWAERWETEDKRTGVPVSEEMKAIFMLNNVTFPKEFLVLVDSRRFDFEKNDPRINELRNAFAQQQISTYDQIAANDDIWRVNVVQDPEQGNDRGYQILIRTQSEGEKTLHVSKEGFIMRDAGATGAPNWVQDPLYHNAVRWQYYNDAGAAATLTEAEKTQMETEKGQVKANEAELKKREKRRKVDEALDTAELAKLKEAATAVGDPKDAEEKKNIAEAKDTSEDKAFLVEGIKFYMDKDHPANVDKVAGILGVLPETTPPTTP